MPVDEKAFEEANAAYLQGHEVRHRDRLRAAITAYEAAKPAPVSPAVVTEEEIARAIYEKHCEQYDATPWWVDEPAEIQREYLAQARAVLALVQPALAKAVEAEREAFKAGLEEAAQFLEAFDDYGDRHKAAAIRSRAQESEAG